MINLNEKLEELADKPFKLHLVGNIAEALSHEIIKIDDGLEFFQALVTKLIAENILQHFIEDDSLPASSIDDLTESVRLFANCLHSLPGNNGFKDYAKDFGKLYRSALQSKIPPRTLQRGHIDYYIGTDDNPIFLKDIDDKNAKFYDTDIAFSKIPSSIELTHNFISLIKSAAAKYNASKLCFVEKRKGPLGTILMVSQIVNETSIPAFIYRASYLDDLSRIKGFTPNENDNVGIVYDAANSGSGLEEVITYLTDSFNCSVKFSAVVVDYEDDAKKRLSDHGVDLVSLYTISEIERFNNDQVSDRYMKEILGQIIEKKVYVQVDDSQKEEFFANELYDSKIPFDSFYNPRDNKTSYRISNTAYNYFVQKGLALEVIEVKNIGDLSVEERNEIKRYHKSQVTKNRKKVLDELRLKYGPINED